MNSSIRTRVSIAAWMALTLGIALNTTMFSAIEGILLRPLPIADIDSVVRVRELARGDGGEQEFSMSPLSYVTWKEHNEVFEDMAAATGGAVTMTGEGEAVRLDRGVTSANFFDVLGVRAALGRTFAEHEGRSGDNLVAILGHGVWQRQFGGDPAIVGRVVHLDGQAHTVIGVMPRGFAHPYAAEIWTPFALDTLLTQATGNYLYVPARLRDGVDLATAQRELDRMAVNLRDDMPQLGPTNASRLTQLRDEVLGSLRPVLFVLLAGSALVLLLAVTNVGNLLLARAVSEQHETALRVALGARRKHLFKRALMRSSVVALGAWAAGLALGALALEPMLGLADTSAIGEFDVGPRINVATAGYAFAIAATIAVALALFETRAARITGPVQVSKEKAGGISRRTRFALVALVSAQIALSFALAGATVLVATGYAQLMQRDRGFAVENLVVAGLTFPRDRYPDPASRNAFLQRALEALRASPTVESAGASTVTPDYSGIWAAGYVVPGHEPPTVPGYDMTHHRLASAGYLATLGVPLLAGRDFDALNPQRDLATVIVSREFAERYWTTPSAAVGQPLTRITRAGRTELTVIGVAGDVVETAQTSAFAVSRAWYMPTVMGTDYDFTGASLVVRGGADVAERIRETVHALDPDMALHRMSPMSERLADAYGRERWSRFMFGVFGLTACVIAVVGLYSALNFIIALRRREFGVRMALGASAGTVARGVLWQALAIGFVGIVAGVPLLAALVSLLDSYFVAVEGGSAGRVAWLAAALGSLVAMAALPPAFRAARTPPAQALAES